MTWESPRGAVAIDPTTRDIVQNIYMRKVERRDGELYNVEFETFPAVKDPAHGQDECWIRVECARGGDVPGRSLIPPLTAEVVAAPRLSAKCHLLTRAVQHAQSKDTEPLTCRRHAVQRDSRR